MTNLRLFIAFALLAPSFAACAADSGDGVDDCVLCAEGKADGLNLTEGSCDAKAVLALANTASQAVLDDEVPLDSRAAAGIVAARAAAELTLSTLDQVPYVTETALERLLAYAVGNGFVPEDCAAPVQTHLLVPLVSEDDESEHLSSYNDQITAAGFDALPDAVAVTDEDTWNDVMDQIDVIAETVDIPLALAYAQSPSDYDGICYRGDAHEIASLSSNLFDAVFGDMYLVLGYRYRDHSELFFDADDDPTGGERIDDWNAFVGDSEDVLILHTEGDSGYEVAASVPRCVGDTPPAPTEALGLTDFACETARAEGDGTATIRFTVKDLGNRDAVELLWPEDEEASPISVAPDTSKAFTLVWGIADGYISRRTDRLRIFTDQAGIEFGELELYEDSGFTRGFFVFESSLGDPGFYTEVQCALTER